MWTVPIASRSNLPPALTRRERAEVEAYFAKSAAASNARLAWSSMILPIAAVLFLLMALDLVRVPAPGAWITSLPPLSESRLSASP